MTIPSSKFTGKEDSPIYSELRLSRLGRAALALQNMTPLSDVPSSREVDQLLHGVVDTFFIELEYPNCQIFLVNQAGTELEFKYGKGPLVEQAKKDSQTWRLKLGEEGLQGKEGPVSWVGSTLKSVNLPDVEASDIFPKPFFALKVRSELTVPMLAHNELVGVIDIQSEEAHAFDNLDLEIVNFFTGQAAAMVQSANLSRLLAESVRDLGVLALTGSKVNNARTLPELGEVMLTNAVRAMNAHSGSMWLMTQDSLQLQLFATLNLPDRFSDNNLSFCPVIMHIMRNGSPVFISSLENYQEELEAMSQLRASGIEAFCCLPLCAQNVQLGALIINYQGPHKFTQTELHLSTILADQAAAALLNVHNLSSLNRLEQQLVRSEQLAMLGQLTSGIAHDFNNLLVGILGLSDILLTKSADQDDQHLLEILRQSALDGAEIIRQLQALGSGKRENSFGSVEIAKILQDVIELTCSRGASEKSAHKPAIEVVFEADLLPPFRGNATELREVFTNLVLNAVDAMPQGGKLDIKIQDCREKQEVWVSVRDNGTGMTEEIKQHLFEPFFTTKVHNGHGLGLSVSQSIIARHEGSIEVESRLNVGSCFTIKLPLKPVAETLVPRKITAPVSPMRVLVVDDDPKLLYVLKRILEIDHHEVTITGSGLEAVKLFTGQPDRFDLVLTDINLKDLNGWQIAQAVRLVRPGLPLIVITGSEVNLQPEKLRHYSITEVITKPYSLEDLQGVIRKLSSNVERRTSYVFSDVQPKLHDPCSELIQP